MLKIFRCKFLSNGTIISRPLHHRAGSKGFEKQNKDFLDSVRMFINGLAWGIFEMNLLFKFLDRF